MCAKDYLKQIKNKREYIERQNSRLKRLRESYASIPALDYSKDRVQTTPGNALEANVCELVERTQKIDLDIIKATLEIDDILATIDLVGSIYSQILSMQYNEGKKLQQIADELDINYNYLCQLNGEALRRLSELLSNSKLI